MKIYTRLPCRRVESDLDDAAARGHLGRVAHYTSLQKFLADAATTPILTSLVEQSAAPLSVIEAGQYAIDSTGFSTAVYDRWFSQKHGKLCSQNAWVKLHIACGTVTHAVTSAVVTPRSDDSQLPGLLTRTRVHHDVRELSADKAYSTHDNHDVLESFDVAAYIPFKDNAVVNPKSPEWSRHLCEFLLHQERFLPHYHRRSQRRDGVRDDQGQVRRRGAVAAAGRAGQRGAREVRRAQPVLRGQGDLHRGARADVLARRGERVVNDLTAKEQKAVRTALRFLRLRVGAWGPLAKALRYEWDSIQKVATGKRAVTPALALRVARFAGIAMDELLAGQWLSARVLPALRPPARRLRRRGDDGRVGQGNEIGYLRHYFVTVDNTNNSH